LWYYLHKVFTFAHNNIVIGNVGLGFKHLNMVQNGDKNTSVSSKMFITLFRPLLGRTFFHLSFNIRMWATKYFLIKNHLCKFIPIKNIMTFALIWSEKIKLVDGKICFIVITNVSSGNEFQKVIFYVIYISLQMSTSFFNDGTFNVISLFA
jgi:hypothetical protein